MPIYTKGYLGLGEKVLFMPEGNSEKEPVRFCAGKVGVITEVSYLLVDHGIV